MKLAGKSPKAHTKTSTSNREKTFCRNSKQFLSHGKRNVAAISNRGCHRETRGTLYMWLTWQKVQKRIVFFPFCLFYTLKAHFVQNARKQHTTSQSAQKWAIQKACLVLNATIKGKIASYYEPNNWKFNTKKNTNLKCLKTFLFATFRIILANKSYLCVTRNHTSDGKAKWK